MLNNQFSSFLLLILIGLAIYLLLSKNDNFSIKLHENFNNKLNIPIDNSVYTSDINNMHNYTNNNLPNQTNTNLTNQTNNNLPNQINNMNINNNHDNINNNTNTNNNTNNNTNDLNNINNINNNIYNQELFSDLSFSTDNNTNNNTTNNNNKFSNNNNSYISTEPTTSINFEQSKLFNFEPTDDSIFNNTGSNLGDAFALPLPSGTNTDTVDFKKQNMENYNAKDFLPHEINDEWFETDFSLAKYQLNDDKLINTDRYIIGINTVGQSLKNASYDIRGTIPNPKFQVGPFNNSTYEPDFNLKPLC